MGAMKDISLEGSFGPLAIFPLYAIHVIFCVCHGIVPIHE